MDNIKIRQGETLTLNVTSEDESAETLRLVVKKEDESAIIDETASYVSDGGKWIASISTDDTNHALGEYLYMFTVTYSDGSIKKFPEADECDDGCDFPTLKICEALDLGVS